jgi:hypothetical protein
MGSALTENSSIATLQSNRQRTDEESLNREAPANSPSRTQEEIRRMNCRKPSPRAPVDSNTRGMTVAFSIVASSSYLCFFSYSRCPAAPRGREERLTLRAEGEVGE